MRQNKRMGKQKKYCISSITFNSIVQMTTPKEYTVDENIIATIKMLFFSIAPHLVITLPTLR